MQLRPFHNPSTPRQLNLKGRPSIERTPDLQNNCSSSSNSNSNSKIRWKIRRQTIWMDMRKVGVYVGPAARMARIMATRNPVASKTGVWNESGRGLWP